MLGLLLVVAACGGVDGSSSIASIARAYAPCGGYDAVAPAGAHVASADRWFHYEASVQRDAPPGAPKIATVVVREYGSSEPQEEQFGIHRSYWPGIDFTVEAGGSVWIGSSAPGTSAYPVWFVLSVLPDGRVFFPGECQHDLLYEPLEQILGEDFDVVLRSLPGASKAQIRAAVGLDEDI